jgi:hypothetical protein
MAHRQYCNLVIREANVHAYRNNNGEKEIYRPVRYSRNEILFCLEDGSRMISFFSARLSLSENTKV